MCALPTVKHRDLSLTALPQGTLVTACDSCGSIGEKPADTLQVSPYYVGRFTTRVPLMEVLAYGAQPVLVIDTLSCELEPTGRMVMHGVQDEMTAAGVAPALLTGSTEENFPTQMTALGVTVVGWMPGGGEWTAARPGDLVYCIGRPQVGAALELEHNTTIASYADLFALRALSGLRELVPTGSHGILWEAENLARYNQLRFIPSGDHGLDLEQSTGPATCLLAITAPEAAPQIESMERASFLGKLCL